MSFDINEINKFSGMYGNKNVSENDKDLERYNELKNKANTSTNMSAEEKAELKKLERHLGKMGKINNGRNIDIFYQAEQKANSALNKESILKDVSIFFKK